MITLPYLLSASLYLLLFYGCYRLLFRRNTFFGLNRAYLLGSIVGSIFLPLLELPQVAEPLPLGTITLTDLSITPAVSKTSGLTTSEWLWLIYGVGTSLMVIRLVVMVRSVLRLIGSGSAEKRAAFTLVRLPDDSSPSFSFGSYLVLNRTDAQAGPDSLLRHEEAHIRQRHTADVLFVEIVLAAFWFNPVVWLYKRALQEVHEFLADRAVLQTPQPDYPQQLVAYALNIPLATLITPFVSKSTLKQRIVMLQKPASKNWSLFSYALVLPLAALLVMCTQSEQDLPQSSGSSRKSVKVEGAVLTLVENSPQFPGGMAKLGEYLGENLKYPEAAQKAKVEGKVFVSFIVTKTGEIADIQILKGIGYGADAEAVRVVKNMPNWTPATQDGKAVNVKFNLPINFQLTEKADKSDAFLKDIKHVYINGKEVDRQKIKTLSPDAIASMNVNKAKGVIDITTK
ncbi:M56 family metallopeptidase [Spirosoma sp. SC4-14]|uniref:M56 family metallopeptidase n=1 Tax=Spirosoma sp. SC4-14 TaxID=3128900 RepID=UPI0030D62B54